jgi:hypothetical protein
VFYYGAPENKEFVSRNFPAILTTTKEAFLGLTLTLDDVELAYLRKIVDMDEERLARWFEKASKPSAVKDINDRMAILQSVRKKLW